MVLNLRGSKIVTEAIIAVAVKIAFSCIIALLEMNTVTVF